VIEFQTEAKLTPNIEPDDLIVKAEYTEFLNETRIHETRPNVDLNVTSCCQYSKLMEQIHVSQYLLQEETKQEVTLQDAAAYWYDTTYIPLAEAIRDRGLLHWFPDRTITDLYVWISDNRDAIEEELGWEIQSTVAATDLILERSVKSEPGSWRKARTVNRYIGHLFADILVPLSGFAESWDALDQALIIAKRENAKLHGLHIVETKDDMELDDAVGVKGRFDQVCKEAGIYGSLAIDVGDVTQRICERAVLADLIVLKITRPPGEGVSALASPIRTIIERSSRPILEVWKTELIVYSALEDKRVTEDTQDYVRRYLELHEVEAEYIVTKQNVMTHLRQTVEEQGADLVLMGSHGGGFLEQVFIGSALDYMLRESAVPIFICR